tara:strand:+ start:304 stop:687 length:384 start_codon:yes stop_codon:yes gene_type:complete
MSRGDVGRVAEAQFVADAARRGLFVSAASTELPGYDVVVDNGTKLFRVQIKGSTSRLGATNPRHTYSWTATSKVSDSKWDIMACLTLENSEWFFYHPSQLLNMYRLTLFSSGKWFDSAYGWDVFDHD